MEDKKERKMEEKIKRHLLAYAPLEDFYVLSPPSGDNKNSLVGFFSKGDPLLLVIDDDEIAEHAIDFLLKNGVKVLFSDEELSEYGKNRQVSRDHQNERSR